MRRRKLLLVTMGAVVLTGAVVAWAEFRPRPRFTMEQVDRIQVGMTVEEVSAVLGCPPGNYTNEPAFASWLLTEWSNGLPPTKRIATWVADTEPPAGDSVSRPLRPAIAIQLVLDDYDKTVRIIPANTKYTPPTILGTVKTWVSRLMTKLGL